jgi:site-specific DNA-adenine methylase|tara:strand:- start:15 stop:776 length:762 start_codon:yes stop_codon:yes gene_type:complete
MKSPIKESVNNFKCLPVLRDLIPPRSVVNSFLFFDGNIEFSLADSNRFVIGHTTQYVIYEFWDCVIKDPERVGKMSNFLFSEIESNMFHIFQETWPKHKDPYLRSAIFFLLNRCSENGTISSGKFVPRNYNPLSVAKLNKFKINNFHLVWDGSEDFLEGINNAPKADFTLLPVGKFSYNFFEHGKNRGFEMTSIDHKKLFKTLTQKKDKWVVIYKSHSHLYKLYKDYNITLVNKYGKIITDKSSCEEVVIANF